MEVTQLEIPKTAQNKEGINDGTWRLKAVIVCIKLKPSISSSNNPVSCC